MHRETFALVCDGPDEFRKVARQMVREGVDTRRSILGRRLCPWARAQQTVMNDAEVEAVCEVARQRGKRAAAHARSAESVKMSLRHGVEIIYHATFADAEATTCWSREGPHLRRANDWHHLCDAQRGEPG
jgi:imidazolonepropionase-like amidohydrolase